MGTPDSSSVHSADKYSGVDTSRAEIVVSTVDHVVAFAGLLLLSGALQGVVASGGASETTAAGDVRIQLMFAPLYVYAVFALALRPLRALRTVFAQPLLLLLAVLVVGSVLWSDVPGVTLRRGLAFVGTYLFGVFLAARFDFGRGIRILAAALGAAAIASVVIVGLMPGWGIMTDLHVGAWRGGFWHKNTMGGAMALGVLANVACSADSKRWRALWAGFAFLCFVLLLLTQSRTAIVVVVSSTLVYLAARRALSLGLYLLVPALVIGALTATLLLGLLVRNYEVILLALGRDATLTGRTALWALLVVAISTRPVLGFGYGAYWSAHSVQQSGVHLLTGWEMSHAHNGPIDVALDIGLAGLCVLTLALLFAFARRVRSSNRWEVATFLSVLALIVLANMTESVLVRHNAMYFPMLIFLASAGAGRGKTAAHTSDVSGEDYLR